MGDGRMLVGIHGDNRPTWSEEAFRRLALAQPDLVKLLTHNRLEVFHRVKALLPQAKVITRLYWPRRPPEPGEFVAQMAPTIKAIISLGYDTFELLNEPNVLEEGFGPDDARHFDAWALEAIPRLREAAPGIRLLWPAMAVHPELNDQGWWERCLRSIEACDGLAVHGYWQPDWAMEDRQWGLRFLVAKEMYPHKPLWMTEAGCTAPIVSKERRARLYPRYVELLRRHGVQGVAFWLLDGTPEWEREQNAFFDDQMARALASIPRKLIVTGEPTIRVGNLEGIVDRRGRLPEGSSYPWRQLADIKYLVVHHTGVDGDSSAEAVAAYHVRTLGWPGIGYHFLVHGDGTCEYVGDILTVRYHVAGRNKEVVGICLTGDFTHRWPGEAQLAAARSLLANLQYALGWFVPIVGHREVALAGHATACPGNTWPQWKGRLTS